HSVLLIVPRSESTPANVGSVRAARKSRSSPVQPIEPASLLDLGGGDIEVLDALDHVLEGDRRARLGVHDVDRERQAPLDEELLLAAALEAAQREDVVFEGHGDPDPGVRVLVEEAADAAVEDARTRAGAEDREVLDRLDVHGARAAAALFGL